MELVIGVAGMLVLGGLYVVLGLADRGGGPCGGCGSTVPPDRGCGACRHPEGAGIARADDVAEGIES